MYSWEAHMDSKRYKMRLNFSARDQDKGHLIAGIGQFQSAVSLDCHKQPVCCTGVASTQKAT